MNAPKEYMKVTEQYFNEETMRFRQMFGDTRNSIEFLDRALKCLGYVFLRAIANGRHPDTTKDGINRMTVAYDAISSEWVMRKILMIMR